MRTATCGILLLALLSGSRIAAWPMRDAKVSAEFKRANPCPANGATRGPCPGYEIDHVQPLKCGGPDAVSNLQWLTIEEHKAKTRAEAKLCRPARKTNHAELPGPA
jgi:hypothetical protein